MTRPQQVLWKWGQRGVEIRLAVLLSNGLASTTCTETFPRWGHTDRATQAVAGPLERLHTHSYNLRHGHTGLTHGLPLACPRRRTTASVAHYTLVCERPIHHPAKASEESGRSGEVAGSGGWIGAGIIVMRLGVGVWTVISVVRMTWLCRTVPTEEEIRGPVDCHHVC